MTPPSTGQNFLGKLGNFPRKLRISCKKTCQTFLTSFLTNFDRRRRVTFVQAWRAPYPHATALF